jgi:sugar/nucleoside kinase (ribokinase family)
MVPDLVLAGHIVKDVCPEGWQPGGGVSFGAVQAQRLGLNVAVVTSCSPDVDPERLFPGVDWRIVPSDQSTSFDNRYAGGRREQRVVSQARQIRDDDVPPDWRASPIVLLTPVYHDVDPAIARAFSPESLVGVAPQGWLRRLENGRVRIDTVEDAPGWLAGDVVFVSEEDVADPASVAGWQSRVPAVVLTRGSAGCTVWSAAGRRDVTAPQMAEVDPTGAGDVFATAFIVRYHETRDSLEAARFACAAAALSITAPRFEAIGDRTAIEAVMQRTWMVRR